MSVTTRSAASSAACFSDAPAGVWLDYTPELLAQVRQAKRPVFLDFTADWCGNCKVWKAAVLNPMKDEFKSRGVVLLKVDCTVRNLQGSVLLRELGRIGVPTWAMYTPGNEKPHFLAVDNPTRESVLGELDALGVRAAAVTSRATMADK